MKDATLSKLGGTCSVLTGVALLAVAAVYLLLPPEQQDACHCPDRFLASLAHTSTLYVVEFGLYALYSLLAIAAVLAISASVRAAHDGWVRWTSTLAIIGVAVTAIDAVRRASLDPARAAAYVQGDAAVKAALTVPGALQGLDPQAWLKAGAFGVWVLVVSLLALRGGTWPKVLAAVGIGVAIVSWLVVAGEVVQSQLLIAILGGAGGIIVIPLWYIWLGLRLRQAR
jgi:hypothetical protein